MSNQWYETSASVFFLLGANVSSIVSKEWLFEHKLDYEYLRNYAITRTRKLRMLLRLQLNLMNNIHHDVARNLVCFFLDLPISCDPFDGHEYVEDLLSLYRLDMKHVQKSMVIGISLQILYENAMVHRFHDSTLGQAIKDTDFVRQRHCAIKCQEVAKGSMDTSVTIQNWLKQTKLKPPKENCVEAWSAFENNIATKLGWIELSKIDIQCENDTMREYRQALKKKSTCTDPIVMWYFKVWPLLTDTKTFAQELPRVIGRYIISKVLDADISRNLRLDRLLQNMTFTNRIRRRAKRCAFWDKELCQSKEELFGKYPIPQWPSEEHIIMHGR